MIHIYKVCQSEERGKWTGVMESGSEPLIIEDSKEEAIKKTEDIARQRGNSKLEIYSEDGKLEEEREYPDQGFE